MRKALIILLCIALLAVPVAAESYASDLQSSVTVAENGTCRVSMTLTVVLTDAPDAPMILLPKGAKSPALNGTSVRTKTVDGLPGIDLSRVITGAGTFVMTGGKIIGGTTDAFGGAINLSGQMVVKGGEIIAGTATKGGAGIWVYKGAKLTVEAGITIEGVEYEK